VPAKNALLVLLGVGITAASLETLARIKHPPPLIEYVASRDARLIYELNPRWPQINDLGMRGPPVDPASLRDHFVIAVIGDSHAYSIGCTLSEDAFPQRLEHHLKTLTCKDVKVLNYGVSGYNMAQELEVLRVKVLPMKPDLVVLQYCINDEHISNYIQPRWPWLNRAIHASAFVTNAWNRVLYSGIGQRRILPYVESHIPDLLLYAPGLVGTPRSSEWDPPHGRPHPPRRRDQVPSRYHDVIGRENLERDVRAFGADCARAGVPALATGFIEEGDAPLSDDSGFNVYSFTRMFDGLNMIDYGYDPAKTAGHFSPRGCDFIGSALGEFIVTHYSIPAGSPEVD
jgi:hypothetical protein